MISIQIYVSALLPPLSLVLLAKHSAHGGLALRIVAVSATIPNISGTYLIYKNDNQWQQKYYIFDASSRSIGDPTDIARWLCDEAEKPAKGKRYILISLNTGEW